VCVTLLRVSPEGAVTPTVLYTQHCDRGPIDPTVCDQPPQLRDIVPDGTGGILARATYTTSAVFDPLHGGNYTSETRVSRITTAGVQYSTNVEPDERVWMVGDGGTAFTLKNGAWNAMDVTNWTPKWSNANVNLEPVTGTLNGGAAMHDLVTDQLMEFDGNGVQLSSTSFGGRWGYQSAFGLWTSSEGALRARFSLTLNQSSQTFKFLGGIGTGQNAPADFSKSTREAAALTALDHIYPIGEQSQWEYGGLICAVGNRFEWSRFVTDQNQSSVNVPDSLCPAGTLRAHLHTHPTKEPSGAPTNPADFDKADAHPGIPYYLRGRRPNTNILMTVKYWNGAGRSALQNLCLLESVSPIPNWVPYSTGSGAVCLTPAP
jgi:hypothetical protein